MSPSSHSASYPASLPAAPAPGRRTMLTLVLLAIAGLAAAGLHARALSDPWPRLMLAYVVAFAFVLSLSLGAMFFVIMQHLTRAGWSVLLRRPAEILAANVVTVAVLFIPIAVSVLRGGGEAYPWAQPDAAAVVYASEPAPLMPLLDEPAPPGDHSASGDAAADRHGGLAPGYEHRQLDAFTLKKRPWLNTPFFLVRWALLLGVWCWLGRRFLRDSLRQDVDGRIEWTLGLERLAGPGILLLGLTTTVGAFDLLMSLNPHWYSTIFGIYYFAGAAVGTFATLVLVVFALQRRGRLPAEIGAEHYLDLGRLLFAFVFFWGYIAFSQYMLLWYAHIPEMTGWLSIRGLTTVPGGVNAWSVVALVLLFGHFLIPFLGLMTRHTKRRPTVLVCWAAWLLAVHYLDLVWLVMPELGPSLTLGGVELGLLVAVGCAYYMGARLLAAGHPLVPAGDPRLLQSAEHEPAY